MASFEIKVQLEDLPNILNAMREWLDQRRADITHFRSASDAGMVTIKVGFAPEDHHAEAFRQAPP
jgi:hypothetical protein